MPLTDEQKAEKWAEKDEAIKADLRDEFIKKQREMKNEFKAVTAEQEALDKQEAAKDYEGRFTRDPNDKTVKRYWDKVAEDAHTLQNEGFQGYNDWAITMMKLVHSGSKIAKAMYYDPIDLTHFIPYRDEIGGTFVGLKDAALEGIADYVGKKFVEDDELPKIAVTVSLNEHGQLDVQVTKDGEPDPDPEQKVKQHIEIGVAAWAETQGCTFDRNTHVFKDASNPAVTMTNEKFKTLNANAEQGLLKFLSGRFEMPLTSSLSPA